jgi:hypothetical protein
VVKREADEAGVGDWEAGAGTFRIRTLTKAVVAFRTSIPVYATITSGKQ